VEEIKRQLERLEKNATPAQRGRRIILKVKYEKGSEATYPDTHLIDWEARPPLPDSGDKLAILWPTGGVPGHSEDSE